MLINEVGTNKKISHIITEFERSDSSALLIRRLKAHHRETYLHSARVALYTLLLADAMEYNQHELTVIYRSAWLHDIGKLNVPHLMLDDDSTKSMDASTIDHCEMGKQIVIQWGDHQWVDVDMVLYHHENLDGTGYYGRNWRQLSLPTRLIRITDSYDKMKNANGIVNSHTMEFVFEELFRWSDIIYDLSVLERFQQIIKSLRTSLLLPYSK
jgi:HD-GYP domain-containing protein (c-di-GMP phosphodiesterase class II)